jgi:hypothetical protein
MKKKVLIAVPTYTGLIPVEVCQNICDICVKLIVNGYVTTFSTIKKSFIDTARNTFAKQLQELDYDYLFFLDDDTYIDPSGVIEMIRMDKDIVSPPVRDRKGGDVLNVFTDNVLVKYKEIDCTKKVKAIGMACTLIKRKVIDDMFKEYYSPFEWRHATYEDKDIMLSEDVSFCLRAEKMGFETWVAKGIKTGHIGEPNHFIYAG